ncbi:MAG: alpha/beta fold hydrolase [Candidatus Aenigmarchaeota archaeon]|nr:alpha/beta fold hydrolase [Candidatus Aenigmarchaeota archaeon]
MTKMKNLKGEPVRITAKDNLELHGILFEPKRKTKKVLIHVHGWTGNFYENKFIDYIAKEAVKSGSSFLTFNNRGVGFVTDLIRRKKNRVKYIRIGGSWERFEDCIIDIKAAVDFVNKKGYKKIILQGHSLGCQKITYYQYKTKDKRVKGMVLIAPVDDVGFVKKIFKKKYEKALKIARQMVRRGKGKKPAPKWIRFYPLITPKKFLDVADPKTTSGKLFYYSGKLKEIRSVKLPVLAIFGSKDDYQPKPEEKLKILKKIIRHCDTRLVKNAGHGFLGFEVSLSKLVGNWIKKIR